MSTPQQPRQDPQQGQHPYGGSPQGPGQPYQPPAAPSWPLPPTQQWQGPYGTGPGTGWWPGAAPPGSVPPAPPTGNAGGSGKPPRRHRAVPAIAAAVLVVAAAAGGVGFGHLWWPGTQSAASSPVAMSSGSGGSSTHSGTSGDGTSGNSGSGNGSGTTNGGSGNGSSGGTSGNGSSGNGGSGNGYGGSQGNGSPGNGGSQGNGGNPGSLPPQLLPGGLFPGGMLPGNGSGSRGGAQAGTITSAPGAPANISGILSKVDKAVVDINDTFAYQQAAGAGTGIVLTSNGEILTNNHVIDGATSISVTDIGNGKTYAASVVGYDPSHDIAVLQLKHASGLTTATIGTSTSLKVGDAVVGIGNAQGVGGTPSAAGGSVTALNQAIAVGDSLYGTTEHLSHLIEVNSDIQSGDSGGPLVTSSGTVVGIDTAAAAGQSVRSQGSQGYAIPIDRAMSIARDIEAGHGTAQIHVGATAALGVLVSTQAQPQQGGLPGENGSGQNGTSSGSLPAGAPVAGVIDGGAVAKTGMPQGSVITSLGGHTITSSSQLSTLMLGYHPGQSVKLGWTDPSGQAHTATVTLGSGPAA